MVSLRGPGCPGREYCSLKQWVVNYASRNGVSARWYYINISHDLIVNQLKALIARDALDYNAYFTIANTMDATIMMVDANVKRAVTELLDGGAAFPIRPQDTPAGSKQIETTK